MPPTRAAARGLSTARAVLQATSLLARRPDGVRADEVARLVGKSTSTAYNLLASLCEEGVAEHQPGGLYRLAPTFRDLIVTGSDTPGERALAGVVEDLLARTHKRAYFGVVRDGRVHVLVERGLQGMPRPPGLDRDTGEDAHALALGKVVLSLAAPANLERYIRGGLRAFTPNTITDAHVLRDELDEVRRAGLAVDCEEFGADFCGLAAPILDEHKRFVGAIGISMSRRAFDDERPALEETLRDVARFQAFAEKPSILDRPGAADVCSPAEPALAGSVGQPERRCRP